MSNRAQHSLKSNDLAVGWFFASFLFGMCFLMGLAMNFLSYRSELTTEAKIYWAVACLILLTFERFAYKAWRRQAVKEIEEIKNLGRVSV